MKRNRDENRTGLRTRIPLPLRNLAQKPQVVSLGVPLLPLVLRQKGLEHKEQKEQHFGEEKKSKLRIYFTILRFLLFALDLGQTPEPQTRFFYPKHQSTL